jgi:hypothetical protein
LAIAVAAHEVLVLSRRRISRIVMVVATLAVGTAVVASAETRRDWRAAYPTDAEAINGFLADHPDGGGILTDWMWWREWSAGVYATEPGGRVCNYSLCTTGTERQPPSALTAPLTSVEARRLTQSWQFVDAAPPTLIVMLTDKGYAAWRTWERHGNPEVLSSFVRPLLVAEGDCFRTVRGLPPTRYCPVFTAGRYVVLEVR